MNLLLLSNSTGESGYLTYALPLIAQWSAGKRRAVFVPFAAVTRSFDEFTQVVQTALASLDLEITPLHRSADPAAAVREAELVMVGGGNTFHLLHHCRRLGLLAPLREAVRSGTPYLGWSAGSNLACPTICTTNDMPIIDAGGLDALGLLPFQINPHYTNALPEGVRGETRNQRIAEFTRVNPEVPVLGLPEGNWVRVDGERAMLHGPHQAWWFRAGREPELLQEGALPVSTS
jgi:dipeptidase E